MQISDVRYKQQIQHAFPYFYIFERPIIIRIKNHAYHMGLLILALSGCIPELTKSCVDMTNSSSTYLGIVGGAAVGAVISWWIYNRQMKTTRSQDYLLQRIKKIEENNSKILSHIEQFTNYHNTVLEKIMHMNERILSLQTKIESMTGKKG